jgi:tetratricopeptide (TPR) repeat protein
MTLFVARRHNVRLHGSSFLGNCARPALHLLARLPIAPLLGFAVVANSSLACIAQQKPAPTSANLRSAESLVEQGRLAEARTAVLDELERHPSSAEAHNLLGVIDSEKKDYSDALSEFQKALQLAPDSPEIHNNLGNAYVTAQKLDLAEKEFRAAIQLDPGNANGNFNLGLLLMAKGSPGEAIPCFLRVHPQTPASKINLVRAYLRAKRVSEALSLSTELSREHAGDAQIHLTLGLMLASEDQYRPAEIELAKADLLKPETFEILFDLGQTYLGGGQYQQADLQLNHALRLRPESPETLYLLARAYVNESRPLDALDLLSRARRLAPNNIDVIFLMAQTAISQRYFEDAIPLLQKGLEIAPSRTDLRLALAESYFKSDQVDMAVAELEKVIAVNPSARAYSFLGLSHIYLGRFDDARQDFQNGLKLEPKNNFCLFNLGYIAKRQGNSAEADTIFQKVLRADPEFPDALLELADIRIESKRYSEAAELLRKYIKVSHAPAVGYYKLFMVERSLHEDEAANKDLEQFQLLSKNPPASSYLYEDLFEYLDNRSRLAGRARDRLDLNNMIEESKKHPDQPEVLYLLASAYLKSGQVDDARNTIAELDKVTASDFRALTGTGVLLARYRFYDDAVQHFEAALRISPANDDIEFDLADAYFRKRLYTQALDAAQQVSAKGQTDDAYLSLLGDIEAHLGNAGRAEEIFRSAITRNPDNDQSYLSLALLDLRRNKIADAKQVLTAGQARMPASGKILWGLGLVSVLEGNTSAAARQLEDAVDMLPEWPGSYSTLGVFYFETGQTAKAREVLERFKNSNAGGLDLNRIEQVLAQAPASTSSASAPLAMADRERLLQLALTLADRTL